MPAVTFGRDVENIVQGSHDDPYAVLGMHRVQSDDGPAVVIRAFHPGAETVEVVDAGSGERTAMERVHDAGFFELIVPGGDRFPYRLDVRWPGGDGAELEDPYRFGSTLGELDLHLLGEGNDLRMYEKLGAHVREMDGVAGTSFAVWAPNAERVSVVGPFNDWDGRRHVMRRHGGVGIWEMFVPGIGAGALYKFEIRPRGGGPPFLKGDPVGFQYEHRPATASVVHDPGVYRWEDDEWMERRRGMDASCEPISIYEVHLGSWRRRGEGDGEPLGYRELAHELADYVTEMGFTHVEFLPVAEHPYDPSWGYQVTGYFAPTSRFGTPDDFRFMVDHLHQRGIGVIIDWVPAHFPKDAHGLRRFDGTALYEHEDPRQGEQPDWGTMVFNFGRNEVRNFLVSNALFWIEEMHADGLRVDAVASMLYLDYSREEGEWVPNPFGGRENLEAISFLRELNHRVAEQCPGVLMIAEESTAWPGVSHSVDRGGLGFQMKWNMGWMNDFVRFMERDPVYRKYDFGLITFSLMYAFSERFILPLSHDEVVHGKHSLIDKMPGDAWQKAANLRLALGFMWGHPGKQLLFMGGEIGQWREWSESRSLDWGLLDYPLHRGMQQWVRDLNHVYRAEPAFWERDFTPDGFEWIDFHDVENTVISFIRRGEREDDEILVVCNFTPIPRPDYRVGVPRAGRYRELLNSDAECYGGSNVGNGGAVDSEPIEAQRRADSLRLVLPPLGVLILKRESGGEE
jgi:1,4-alpha-glucan branching enzyme